MTKPRRYLDLRGKEERAADARAANQREAAIAQQYLNSGPSFGNLARAAYHWYNSVPMLGGQNESGLIIQGGEAPIPTRPTSAVEALAKANQIIKNTRAARIDKAKERVDFANNYIKNLFSAKNTKSVRPKNTTVYTSEEAQQLGVDTGENIITGRGGNRWQSSNNYGGTRRRYRKGGVIDNTEKRDATYVAKDSPQQVYRFQPTIRDLGGSPGRTLTQEDRNRRQRTENNIKAVQNLIRGLDNTFGTAISLASLLYGGGWAGTRLLAGNKATPVGQVLSKYVLPANTVDTAADAVGFIGNPSVSGALDLASGLILGRYKDFGKKSRQVGELIGQGANVGNIAYKDGGSIHIAPSKRGTFTAAATKHRMGVQEFASKVLRNKEDYSPSLVKKANFARNASKWH